MHSILTAATSDIRCMRPSPNQIDVRELHQTQLPTQSRENPLAALYQNIHTCPTAPQIATPAGTIKHLCLMLKQGAHLPEAPARSNAARQRLQQQPRPALRHKGPPRLAAAPGRLKAYGRRCLAGQHAAGNHAAPHALDDQRGGACLLVIGKIKVGLAVHELTVLYLAINQYLLHTSGCITQCWVSWQGPMLCKQM